MSYCIASKAASSVVSVEPAQFAQCGHGHRPAAVEGEVGDQLDELFVCDAVVPRVVQVERQLFGAVECDERRHGGDAALARSETGACPDVAEQHLVGELGQLRSQVADGFAGVVGIVRHARPRRKELTGRTVRKASGDLAPKLAELTDEVSSASFGARSPMALRA